MSKLLRMGRVSGQLQNRRAVVVNYNMSFSLEKLFFFGIICCVDVILVLLQVIFMENGKVTDAFAKHVSLAIAFLLYVSSNK